MQPHSMCALAAANLVWNTHEDMSGLSMVKMDVSYRNKDAEYKLNKYELSNFNFKSEREFEVMIIRAGGGIACTMTVRRKSTEPGSGVVMTHSQNHISGLREEFSLYKNKVKSGQHYNSKMYKCFEGEGSHPERKALKLRCEIKRKTGHFMPSNYELTVTSIVKKERSNKKSRLIS